MDFKMYQEKAATTAIYPNRGSNLNYPTLGLCSEAGEVAGKVKKVMRDFGGVVSPEMKENLKAELGDVLWYISNCCDELGLDLDAVAEANIAKLAARMQQNKIHGSGDNR